MEEDEYVFESSVTAGSGSEADAFARVAKKAVGNKLRPIFQQFPKDMIAVHGKDLLDDSTPTDSGASTPVSASAPAPAVPSGATAPAASSTNAKSTSSATTKQSTATVRATGEFQCSADDLFDFLTNPQKIPMWSRNPAQMAPEVGADVSLFGGNIRGKVEKVERPRGFTMTWRAPTWPEDLYGQLEAALDQGSNSTSLSLTLRGVPVGKEDETETNVSSSPSRPFRRASPVSLPASFSAPNREIDLQLRLAAPHLLHPRPAVHRVRPPFLFHLYRCDPRFIHRHFNGRQGCIFICFRSYSLASETERCRAERQPLASGQHGVYRCFGRTARRPRRGVLLRPQWSGRQTLSGTTRHRTADG